VVVGGGNARKLKSLPPGARAGNNANAFLGGFRLWQQDAGAGAPGAQPLDGKRVANVQTKGDRI